MQIVDSNDYLALDTCQKLYDKSEKTQADMIFLSAVSVNANTGELLFLTTYRWKLLPKNKVFSLEDIVKKIFLALSQAWNKFYRKDFIINNNNFFDIELKLAFPNTYFSFNNYINTKRMYLVKDICYFYSKMLKEELLLD